jgi:hypothetical protein
MFKPGTLVKLSAGYEIYLGVINGQAFGHADFWVDQTHIGLMLGDVGDRHVLILIGEQVVIIETDVLSEISV